MSELRNKLRAVTLGAPAVRAGVTVEWAGERMELRRPTLAQQRAIDTASTDKKGRKDGMRALILALIQCVYVPGTDEPVFERGDVEALEAQSEDGFIGALMKGLRELAKLGSAEEVEKNSDGDPTASP